MSLVAHELVPTRLPGSPGGHRRQPMCPSRHGVMNAVFRARRAQLLRVEFAACPRGAGRQARVRRAGLPLRKPAPTDAEAWRGDEVWFFRVIAGRLDHMWSLEDTWSRLLQLGKGRAGDREGTNGRATPLGPAQGREANRRPARASKRQSHRLRLRRRRRTGQDESEVRMPQHAGGIDRPSIDDLEGF